MISREEKFTRYYEMMADYNGTINKNGIIYVPLEDVWHIKMIEQTVWDSDGNSYGGHGIMKVIRPNGMLYVAHWTENYPFDPVHWSEPTWIEYTNTSIFDTATGVYYDFVDFAKRIDVLELYNKLLTDKYYSIENDHKTYTLISSLSWDTAAFNDKNGTMVTVHLENTGENHLLSYTTSKFIKVNDLPENYFSCVCNSIKQNIMWEEPFISFMKSVKNLVTEIYNTNGKKYGFYKFENNTYAAIDFPEIEGTLDDWGRCETTVVDRYLNQYNMIWFVTDEVEANWKYANNTPYDEWEDGFDVIDDGEILCDWEHPDQVIFWEHFNINDYYDEFAVLIKDIDLKKEMK